MVDIFVIIAFLVFLGGALPARWSLRIWPTTWIIGGTLIVLQPTIRSEARGMFDGFEVVLFWTFMLTTLTGIVLRPLIARFLWPPLSPPSQLSPEETGLLHTIDKVIVCGLGIISGLFFSLSAALILRGSQGGLMLHLSVSGIAALAAIWGFRNFTGHVRIAAGTALAVVSASAILGGTVWPFIIKAQADDIMSGLPRCLRALDRPAAVRETMLLTLPEGQPGSPGLILTVMTADGAQHFRWSYRANHFVRYGSYRFGDCQLHDIE